MAAGRRTLGQWSIRWDQALADAAYGAGLWSRETLTDALSVAAAQTPERVLLVEGETRLTAARLSETAQKLAKVMAARMPEGSAISFMLPNWHEAATIYMAATLAGMVANPILPSLRDHDLKFILDDVNCRMIFIPAQFRSHDYAAMLGRVKAELATPPDIVVLRGDARDHIPYDALLEEDAHAGLLALDPEAVRMVMYTSGTTGRPKGVLHSHNSLNALIRQIGKHWLVEPGDKFLVPSPISHIGGSIYAFECPLLLGSTAVLMDQWNPDDAINIMQAEGITHMAGATPFLQQLLKAAIDVNTRLPELKLFICGGASVPPSLVRAASEFFELAIVSRVYGSTEIPVTTVGVIETSDVDHAAETDGRPGVADVKIADGGEIRAKGPQMLVGYAHPEDEDNAFDEDGYYRTGDQGVWQDGNHLVVTGRIKDLIIRNGENIAPKEMEDLLIQHPDISEIAIVGLPDPRTGERACAVIVPTPGATPNVPTLSAFLAAKGVARFKYPEAVVLWNALPKNEAGKVVKPVIRKRLLAAQS